MRVCFQTCRTAAWVIVVMGVFAGGCGEAGTEELPTVPPPPDLAAIDPPVQAQYRARRAALDEVLARPGATAVEKAAAYGALGQWYHVYLFYGGAEAAYGGARILAPEDPRWPYYLAHVARARGAGEEARTWLRRVLELEAENLAAEVWLAETEWEAGREEAAAKGFDAALKRDPRSVRALAGRAKVALARGQPAAAVELLEKALALQPQAAVLRHPLGLAYRQLGDRERAAAELARVPAENRQHVPLALQDPWMDELEALRQGANVEQVLGRRAFEAGHLAAAADHFRRALEADPDNVEARINLALTLQRAGKAAAAVAAATEAVARDPSYARSRLVLGNLLLQGKRFDAAQAQFEAAVEADPDHEMACFNLAQLLRGRGRLEEALPHYARVRRLDPRMVQAGHGYAVTLLWLGRPGSARAAIEEDLQRVPGDRQLTLLLARLLAASPEESLRDGARALELAGEAVAGGATLTAAETFAMAAAEVGRFDAAAAWQGAALAAVQNAGQRNLVPRLEQRLDLYRRRQPCREPWARGEVPSPLSVAAPGGLEGG